MVAREILMVLRICLSCGPAGRVVGNAPLPPIRDNSSITVRVLKDVRHTWSMHMATLSNLALGMNEVPANLAVTQFSAME